MKKHSKMEKKTKPKELEKKDNKSSEILSDIMKDYDSIPEKKEEKEKIDIFKWQTLENTVLCKAFNNFLPDKKNYSHLI